MSDCCGEQRAKLLQMAMSFGRDSKKLTIDARSQDAAHDLIGLTEVLRTDLAQKKAGNAEGFSNQ